MKMQSLCVQQNGPVSPDGDIVPPIHTSVIFAMDTLTSDTGPQYGRIHNQTRTDLENVLARIHHAAFGITAASGSAAITLTCLLLSQHSTVLHHTELYEGTRRILHTVMRPFGVTGIPVDFHDLLGAETQIIHSKPTLVWIETPTNPSLRVLDIARIAALSHRNGALIAVDTTMCSGMLQHPLTMGADIVVESLTKGLNGHSDALGGFIGTNDKHIADRVRFLAQTTGSVLDPVSASLILRGIKTAPIRMKVQQQTAQAVAKWLSHHPLVTRVMTPGIHTPAEQRLARQQMFGKGQVISFILKPGVDPKRVAKKLKLIRISHSFGSTETLIQHPTSMMDWSDVSKPFRPDSQLFRLSLGLEHPEDIVNDLKQALEE